MIAPIDRQLESIFLEPLFKNSLIKYSIIF